MRMMGSLRRYEAWSEPMIGELFGEFYNRARQDQLPSKNYIMGEPCRESWLRSIRSFVLEGAKARYPGLEADKYLVIKESTASEGASLISEAMPQSGLIFLIREPRDIVASNLDAAKRGSWMYERIGDSPQARVVNVVEQDPELFVRSASETLMKHLTGAKRAYEAHRGPKVLVRYEDLREDTLPMMRRIYETLELPFTEEGLRRVVEKHSWENIPEQKKGEGKFFRKAKPGGWKEDLTPEQATLVEEITAPILKEYYGSEDRNATRESLN